MTRDKQNDPNNNKTKKIMPSSRKGVSHPVSSQTNLGEGSSQEVIMKVKDRIFRDKKNVKHFLCNVDGHAYWIKKGVLYSCPTNADGSLDKSCTFDVVNEYISMSATRLKTYVKRIKSILKVA